MHPTNGLWQVAGFLFTSILGTFLHFLFDLTGQSLPAAFISAVNESIWEHMKLIYYPMVIFALTEARFRKDKPREFWCRKLQSILLALALIPACYYTYTGALGISSDWINISIFFLAAGAAYYLEYRRSRQNRPCPLPPKTAIGVIFLIGLVFTIFTFFTPRLPFFRDPVTGTYGFRG